MESFLNFIMVYNESYTNGNVMQCKPGADCRAESSAVRPETFVAPPPSLPPSSSSHNPPPSSPQWSSVGGVAAVFQARLGKAPLPVYMFTHILKQNDCHTNQHPHKIVIIRSHISSHPDACSMHLTNTGETYTFMGWHMGARCAISPYIFITSAVLRVVTTTSVYNTAASNLIDAGERGGCDKKPIQHPTLTQKSWTLWVRYMKKGQ